MSDVTVQGNNQEFRNNKAVEKPISKKSYFIGLVVIFVSVYSQYLVPEGFGLVLGFLIVYGIPVVATGLLWGRAIIRKALSHTYTALKFGLGFFGAFTVLSLFLGFIILFVILFFDPSAENLLFKPNPVLNIPPDFAWIMVFVSFLVIGPAEEYLFRGFIYGGLLSLSKHQHWLSLAFVSALLFAGVHLYYVLVYGVVSLIQLTDLVAFGMAMAAAYYYSGGNLLVPAVIHGAYDATAFVGVATSLTIGAALREFMILIGIVAAIVIFAQRGRVPMNPQSGDATRPPLFC